MLAFRSTSAPCQSEQCAAHSTYLRPWVGPEWHSKSKPFPIVDLGKQSRSEPDAATRCGVLQLDVIPFARDFYQSRDISDVERR